jgi:hypothetical protein
MEVAALVAFLAPCLGSLLSGVQAAVGEDVWVHVKRLWAKLGPKAESTPAALEAVEALAAQPEDARARRALELQLEKLLATDPELADAIGHLWEDAKAAGVVAAGTRNVAVGGSVSASTIVTGDSVTIRE